MNIRTLHHPKTLIQRHRKTLVTVSVVCILALGAFLRLWRISEYMTFLGDEGRDVLVVKQMIVDHKFTLLGPTSSVGGFFLGPVYYYFMLPFLWAWRLDPTGPAVMVAVFGIATIYVVYRLGRELFGTGAGIIAALLYAVSPLVIAYSRSSWNPNVVPFFSTLLLYLLWRVVVRRRWRDMFWVGAVMGIGLQLHYLFLFLFVLVGFWFLIYGRKREYVRFYGLGFAGLVVGLSPYLAFELRHGFVNTQTVIRFLGEGKETGFILRQFLANMNDVPFRLFGRLVFRLPQPEIWDSLLSSQRLALAVVIRTTLYVGLGILAFLALRYRHEHQKQASILLLLWFIVPVLLFGFYKKAIYDYYFGIFYALPFLVTALVLTIIARLKRGTVACLLLLFALLLYNWQGQPFRYPPNNQLAQMRGIAREALDQTGGKPFNFALIADNNSDHAYRYFFEISGNKPVTIEYEGVDPARTSVTDQLIVICEKPECRPLGNSLWEIAGFGRAEIVGEWRVSFVTIFRLIHYTPQDAR